MMCDVNAVARVITCDVPVSHMTADWEPDVMVHLMISHCFCINSVPSGSLLPPADMQEHGEQKEYGHCTEESSNNSQDEFCVLKWAWWACWGVWPRRGSGRWARSRHHHPSGGV